MAQDATEAKASSHIQTTEKRQSRLTKDSGYRDRCRDGFKGPHKPDGKRWEAHHIVCEHSMAQRDTNTYVENCLWITDWDINHEENLIGLPRNREFREDDTSRATEWVSHQVGHNTSEGYTEECRKWLQKKVFKDLNAAKKNHETDADDIWTLLKSCQDHFKGLLAARSIRPPGIVKGWAKRFDENYEKTWYIPFSMAASPRYRSPGVSLTNPSKVFNLLD